jgi:hypothetical protein
MQIVKLSQQQRKEDARKKIMLGGLLVKAGLDHFGSSVFPVVFRQKPYNLLNQEIIFETETQVLTFHSTSF